MKKAPHARSTLRAAHAGAGGTARQQGAWAAAGASSCHALLCRGATRQQEAQQTAMETCAGEGTEA